MSKFVIEISDAPFMKTFLLRYAGETLEIAAADLPELVSAAQAALAEQNSGVMGATQCKCAIGKDVAICDSFKPIPHGPSWCDECAHDDPCHQPQAQRREA